MVEITTEEKPAVQLAKAIIQAGQKRCSGHILIFDELSLVQLINKELIEYDSMMKELFGANSTS